MVDPPFQTSSNRWLDRVEVAVVVVQRRHAPRQPYDPPRSGLTRRVMLAMAQVSFLFMHSSLMGNRQPPVLGSNADRRMAVIVARAGGRCQ